MTFELGVCTAPRVFVVVCQTQTKRHHTHNCITRHYCALHCASGTTHNRQQHHHQQMHFIFPDSDVSQSPKAVGRRSCPPHREHKLICNLFARVNSFDLSPLPLRPDRQIYYIKLMHVLGVQSRRDRDLCGGCESVTREKPKRREEHEDEEEELKKKNYFNIFSLSHRRRSLAWCLVRFAAFVASSGDAANRRRLCAT